MKVTFVPTTKGMNQKGFRMAKSKIITPGLSLGGDVEAVEHRRSPRVVGVKPAGSQVLVEVLTAQELANTNITISEKMDLKVPLQGYVRAAGPTFKETDWGFKVGDRVLISTNTAVMAPNYDGCHRDRFFMEPHSIRGVLSEEE